MTEPRPDGIRRVTVFTGSKHGNADAYVEAVEAFAQAVADRGIDVAVGGGETIFNDLRIIIVQNLDNIPECADQQHFI